MILRSKVMIPPNCIPAKQEIVIELESNVNKDGNHTFFAYWLTDYQPGCLVCDRGAPHTHIHAQIFVTNLAEFRKRTRKQMRIVDNGFI